jgi:hypothetical protein
VRTQRQVRSTDGIRVQAQEGPEGCPVCGGTMQVNVGVPSGHHLLSQSGKNDPHVWAG